MPRENPETRERIRLLRVRDRAQRAHLKVLERSKLTEFALAKAEKEMRQFDETILLATVSGLDPIKLERARLQEASLAAQLALTAARVLREQRVAAGTYDEAAHAEFAKLVRDEFLAGREVVEFDVRQQESVDTKPNQG